MEAFAEKIVPPIDSHNAESVWNSIPVNEVNYVNKNDPLKTKYVRNHTCPFIDDELRNMKRSRRKIGKTYRKNGNSEDKNRLMNSVLDYLERFTEKKSEHLDKCVASKKSVLGNLCFSNF